MPSNQSKLIIANASGFYGDRFSAPAEMVRGGPIDVLTGDYLAELTMAILSRQQQKEPAGGYATTFPKQIKEILGECLQKGIKIVTNAGGVNPAGLAAVLHQMAHEQGLNPRIATITGDNILPHLPELMAQGETFTHLDHQKPLTPAAGLPISANVYLGGWGIARALQAGADIVITGRVTDAALVLGPAAWYFGWPIDEWDKLAGAVTAGHIIECGAQCTGGNYSFMEEVPTFHNLGFPIAEIYADGSAVITKHPGTGGVVNVGTVTAQLVYEIGAPAYLTPDVTAHFDTITLSQEAPDRVRVSGVKGSPPPTRSKVTLNLFGGFRNEMTVLLTGLNIERKAEIVQEVLWQSLGGREKFAQSAVQLIRSDKFDPPTNEEAWATLRLSVMDMDEKKVGRPFSAKVVELALANIPGFNLTNPPEGATPFVRHWPTLLGNQWVQQTVTLGEEQWVVPAWPGGAEPMPITSSPVMTRPVNPPPAEELVQRPFGLLFGTRSGDKGGNANLGVWAKNEPAYTFLVQFLTEEKLKQLLPDVAQFPIVRYELPNLLALNFVIQGILGDGVAASTRPDAQAKTLGEYLRAKLIWLPKNLL